MMPTWNNDDAYWKPCYDRQETRRYYYLDKRVREFKTKVANEPATRGYVRPNLQAIVNQFKVEIAESQAKLLAESQAKLMDSLDQLAHKFDSKIDEGLEKVHLIPDSDTEECFEEEDAIVPSSTFVEDLQSTVEDADQVLDPCTHNDQRDDNSKTIIHSSYIVEYQQDDDSMTVPPSDIIQNQQSVEVTKIEELVSDHKKQHNRVDTVVVVVPPFMIEPVKNLLPHVEFMNYAPQTGFGNKDKISIPLDVQNSRANSLQQREDDVDHRSEYMFTKKVRMKFDYGKPKLGMESRV